MRLKQLFSVIFILLVNTVFGQLQDIKICIDPGHGGHNPSNDRKITLPYGIIFWESEGNLMTAFHERDLLQSLGAEVKMTRTGNDDSDDISLSSRVAIANAFGADYFHSNHTNAG
ncbi:MAG TPA: N-acetylmuramoyl-L-alanine amidase, partial [Bacteroidetes bacterium]|nr:N-acetylmuramoyl-L-alanine amidase [Bacteroidota bacterium]